MRSLVPILALAAALVLVGSRNVLPEQQGAPEPAGRQWAVVIGVNEYLDPAIPDLKYCVADARRVFEALTEHGGFEANRVLLITDDQARAHLRPLRVNFERQIGDWLDHARPEDTVVVYFSGHGFVDEPTGQGFLAPSDAMRADLRRTGFPTERLRQMLRNCKARQKLLVLDCCFAGAVRDGAPTGVSGEELSKAFEDARGLITLASSRKDQWSYECDKREAGLFTYYFAKGLSGAADYDRDGLVNVDELYRYTFDHVPRVAQQERNARQHPVRVIGPDTEGVFPVARVSIAPRPLEESFTLSFTVRERDSSGRLVEGALVDVFYRESAGGRPQPLGQGTSDAEGRVSLVVRPTLAQQAAGDFMAIASLAGASRTFRLERFPQARSFRLYVPRPSRPPLAVAPFTAPQAAGHQDAWSRYLGKPVEKTNSIGMKLVLIPPGEFMMGSPEAEEGRFDWEGPQHRVRITKPFYLGAHEVTVGQFRRFVSDAGYKTDAEKDGKGGFGVTADGNWEQKPEYTWRNPGFPQTDEHPVVNVSWNDAVAFCEWLSGKEGREYRLPTEAEWEYACRAGTTTRYYHGNEEEGLAQVGNVADAEAKKKFPGWTTISASDGYVYTAPVGKFRANGFGLYDMHGNVWEWCSDWYDAKYYANSPVDNPKGPASGSYRVVRGGSWRDSPRLCRSASRLGGSPVRRCYDLGFRVAWSSVDE